ncbi:tRNA (uridine(54)-C5)-methyltransferase TrmA [Campylobacter cuniculorum]|uniref:tRNA m5U54 methyltransferase n=2 Tax=Campylobacter cuniculorum TaxID=374106 RepID=A0A1W6BWI1_9BACT|nr:tRNA (uridine(54)-C5)-methyltransferase TrmA [Campylobacter cuniculorum]ARJ56442.1 tRNA m5U54 methyltransferase [Campylobacter cuniculorum DSM 23162 = LMG 24588]QOR03927.1 tRNA (uridine(54)-C5)-methyltransferase TrmA [Campylobacter cuniculorum]
MKLENLFHAKSLEEKAKIAQNLFKDFYAQNFELFSSPHKHFRTRAELSFFHNDEGIFYAMFDAKNKKKYIVENLDFVNKKIYNFMPLILEKLNANSKLNQKLFGAEFLATKLDFSVTLLYHKDISCIQEDLKNLSKELNINLIARSKGKKLIFGQENLKQSLNIKDEEFFYEFSADCFIQPNTAINEKIIEWILKILKDGIKKDLLELYCGYGNFTLPLSKCFKKVLATELCKKNIEFALKNCILNEISNINFIRMSSEDLSKAFKKERKFYRLKELDLDDFNFSHILVDPPRSGLSTGVIELIKNFENIIYISCNPLSLKENLTILNQSHKITDFAFFDQFKDTPHLECGVLLKKR